MYIRMYIYIYIEREREREHFQEMHKSGPMTPTQCLPIKTKNCRCAADSRPVAEGSVFKSTSPRAGYLCSCVVVDYVGCVYMLLLFRS